MRALLTLLFFFFISACASSQKNNSGVETISESQYKSQVESWSDKTKRYKGLHNTIEVGATLLSLPLLNNQLKYRAGLYQWDQTAYKEEEQKNLVQNSQRSQVFLSFYTPDRKMDDLSKNKSLWKIFLDVSGKRFEGKVEKINLPTTEINTFYPYHSRFSTAYLITFPVSLTEVSQGKVELTLTSTLDSATLRLGPNH